MVYPPGQGKSGNYLMDLWRRYLEEFAEKEGQVEQQILVASFHCAEIFGCLARTLDRPRRLSKMIGAREQALRDGIGKAAAFGEHLANAVLAIYGQLQALAVLLAGGSREAGQLIRDINDRFRGQVREGDALGATAAAMRAAFPLVSIAALAVDRSGILTDGIRKVENRFRESAGEAPSDWDQLLNALYRVVEMMQLLVVISDADLRSQVEQIAAHFEEEDRTRDRKLKLRNGFCRLFELGHLLTTHLDDIL